MAQKLCIGELRHKITIERKSLGTADTLGQRASTWAALTSVWAKMEAKAANEKSDTGRKTQLTEFEFTTRYFAGVSTADRISYDGSYYTITGAFDKEGTRQWLTIKAVKDDTKLASGEVV